MHTNSKHCSLFTHFIARLCMGWKYVPMDYYLRELWVTVHIMVNMSRIKAEIIYNMSETPLMTLTGPNLSLLKLPITDFYLHPDAVETQVAVKTPHLLSQGWICCGPPTLSEKWLLSRSQTKRTAYWKHLLLDWAGCVPLLPPLPPLGSPWSGCHHRLLFHSQKAADGSAEALSRLIQE